MPATKRPRAEEDDSQEQSDSLDSQNNSTTFKKRKLTNAEKQQPHNKSKDQRAKLQAAQKKKLKKRQSGKDTVSLGEDATAFLSDELKRELGINENDDAASAAASGIKQKKSQLRTGERYLSKSEMKRLAQLQKKKEAKSESKTLLVQLKENELPEDQRALLRSSAHIGKRFKETAKEQLQRAMMEQQAGVPISVDLEQVAKYVSRKQKDRVDQWSEDQDNELYYADEKNGDGSGSDDDSDNGTGVADVKPTDSDASESVSQKAQQSNSKPFMVLDFGFGAPTDVESAKASETSTTEVSEQESEEQAADSNGEEDENLSWREQVCKGFDELIDLVDGLVADEEKRSLILQKVGEVFGLVLEDSDAGSDNEADEEEDGEQQEQDGYSSAEDSSDDMDDTDEQQDINQQLFGYKDGIPVDLRHLEAQQAALPLPPSDMQLIAKMIDEREDAEKDKKKQWKESNRYYVQVNRTETIERQRQALPVFAQEQQVMEHIEYNDVVIICGETGSGKTTQVPQFLYEAGYGQRWDSKDPKLVSEAINDGGRIRPCGMVGVTQPRRVAAVSTAKRVAEELNVQFGNEVGYQVRYDTNIADFDKVNIKFMTDGILMREIQEDPLLLNYSALLIDEAHERNVNTDILIGWLSRFLPQRNKMARSSDPAVHLTPDGRRITPLKLIIMSATLRVDDFVNNPRLFPCRPSQTAAPTLEKLKKAAEKAQRAEDGDDGSDQDDSDSDSEYDMENNIMDMDEAVSLAEVANKPPPVINIKARQYPVTIHFNKRTVFEDYVQAVLNKVTKMHEKLPDGGILVFLTGKQEIDYVVNRLREMGKKASARLQAQQAAAENQMSDDDDEDGFDEEEYINQLGDLDEDEEENKEGSDSDSSGLDSDSDDASDSDADSVGSNGRDPRLPKKIKNKIFGKALKRRPPLMHVLPLYSMLQPNEQLRVFEPLPDKKNAAEGDKSPSKYRMIIIATNVAETSLTIPGIRYVVDAGRVKDKKFDMRTNVSKFVVQWTSKASADQRAGRAGRTSAGHCYRLFSSAVYDQHFQQFTDPDILKTPIDSVALQMKAMGIKNVPAFPFPTPPDAERLQTALHMLQNLGAISIPQSLDTKDDVDGTITKLGRSMAEYPVLPRFAKMILLASKQQDPVILSYVIAIVSAMTVGQIFTHDSVLSSLRFKEMHKEDGDSGEMLDDYEALAEEVSAGSAQAKRELSQREKETKDSAIKCKNQWAHAESDILSMLKAVGAYEFQKSSDQARAKFCKTNLLHAKNMREVHKLRYQLHRIVEQGSSKTDRQKRSAEITIEDVDEREDAGTEGDVQQVQLSDAIAKLPPPTAEQEIVIRQIICAGFVDQVARLATADDCEKLKLPFFDPEKHQMRPYITLSTQGTKAVYIHPHSFINVLKSHANLPQYVVFQEMSISGSRSHKWYMRGVTAIQPEWLTAFACGNLVRFSRPLEDPAPRFNIKSDQVVCFVTPTFGFQSKSSEVSDNQQGWQLPAHEIPYPLQSREDLDMVTRIFAKLLLEGKVFKDLKQWSGKLRSSPSELLQKNSLSKKAVRLLDRIKQVISGTTPAAYRSACTRKALQQRWKKDKSFLLAEVLEFVKPEEHKSLRESWPPANQRNHK